MPLSVTNACRTTFASAPGPGSLVLLAPIEALKLCVPTMKRDAPAHRARLAAGALSLRRYRRLCCCCCCSWGGASFSNNRQGRDDRESEKKELIQRLIGEKARAFGHWHAPKLGNIWLNRQQAAGPICVMLSYGLRPRGLHIIHYHYHHYYYLCSSVEMIFTHYFVEARRQLT